MGIHVLIIDDSATARSILMSILKSAPFIESVDSAPDAFIGRDKMVKNRPDVVCLDVEMPRMDGITFLKKIMQHMPTPVVMVSSLTQKGAKTTLDALEAGAIDFVAKPHTNLYDSSEELEKELLEKVQAAAKVTVKKFDKPEHLKPLELHSALSETTQKIIAVGASTGGTVALRELLSQFPINTPGIIVVQHMPENFTSQFAQNLNQACKMEVKEAQHGDSVSIGKILIAPGNIHMVLRRSGARYHVELGSGDKISGHRPSVDIMFNSVAKTAGSNAIGIILTGMGADGAKGMKNLSNVNALTIAQDEQSCVVFGMPKVAIELGGVKHIEPLNNIANRTLKLISKMS
jgi:two-component system, chemotaxis family, protein-glutamate methylesterase/glutaminase